MKIDIKEDLYLPDKSEIAFEEMYKKYVIAQDSVSEAEFDDDEEVDSLMILLCWFVAKHDPFTSCTVYLPDTDEFLLLLHIRLCYNH